MPYILDTLHAIYFFITASVVKLNVLLLQVQQKTAPINIRRVLRVRIFSGTDLRGEHDGLLRCIMAITFSKI